MAAIYCRFQYCCRMPLASRVLPNFTSYVYVHHHSHLSSTSSHIIRLQADKSYNQRALGNVYKNSPTSGSWHAKGIVLEKVGVEAKQPNSAIMKCVHVQLIKNGKKFTALVPVRALLITACRIVIEKEHHRSTAA